MKKFQENGYKFVKYLNPDEDISEGEARQQAMYVLIVFRIPMTRFAILLVPNAKKINAIIYLQLIPSLIWTIPKRCSN